MLVGLTVSEVSAKKAARRAISSITQRHLSNIAMMMVLTLQMSV